MDKDDTTRLEALRLTIGRAFGVDLSDVGAWDVDGRLAGGFWDPRLRRPRTFHAAELAPGTFRLHEEEPTAAAAA
ncbi:MAG TPA: hypothetical protein VLB76_08725 [Thermoanaerobaculia bacterium]|jgi:hypothetical protein|nr:hypothetical protein [Thermoanaerobaculia bacterium]